MISINNNVWTNVTEIIRHRHDSMTEPSKVKRQKSTLTTLMIIFTPHYGRQGTWRWTYMRDDCGVIRRLRHKDSTVREYTPLYLSIRVDENHQIFDGRNTSPARESRPYLGGSDPPLIFIFKLMTFFFAH